MNRRLENIKANAKNLCKPTTTGDFGVVLNTVWLETIEGLCNEIAKFEAENKLLKEIKEAARMYLEYGEPELADELATLLTGEDVCKTCDGTGTIVASMVPGHSIAGEKPCPDCAHLRVGNKE